MTRSNTPACCDGALPLVLSPHGKSCLWGGRRLRDVYSKDIDLFPLAETWECSAHPDGQSIVRGGEFDGMLLGDVLRLHPEYLGTNCGGEMPVLIKLIDATADLSVQVHPNDEYAALHENGQRGKTELWYVLDAEPGARIIYGFEHDVDRETVLESIASGTLSKLLQSVEVRKDDVFFIPAGTVHAICAGVLIAEVQQSSNITYRLFDYDRADKNGVRRELHIEKALDVAELRSAESPRQPMRVLRYERGCAREQLCSCRYFTAERMLINTERQRSLADLRTDESSFCVLLCTDGCGTIFCRDTHINFFSGDCIFIPASSAPLKLHGRATVLKVSL